MDLGVRLLPCKGKIASISMTDFCKWKMAGFSFTEGTLG